MPELFQLYSSLKGHVNGLLKLNYYVPKKSAKFLDTMTHLKL
jgi:hypothetical protein